VLRDLLENWEAAAPRGEVLDVERRLGRAFARPASWCFDRLAVSGLDPEERLGRNRAPETLMRPEAEVVEECHLEAALQVIDGEGELEPAEPGHLLE